MKKVNWMALPGVLVTSYFIWIGITNIKHNPLFYCVWLGIAGMGCYRSFQILLGKGIVTNHSASANPESRTENRLRELDSLYQQGLITREEFDKKREDILNDL